MADKVGVIDTSLIKTHAEEKQKHRKKHKEKRHHEPGDYNDAYQKTTPLPILMAREAEKRKNIQKAKMKARQKEYKHEHRGSKKHHSRKYDGAYGKDREEDYYGPKSAFSNGGSYRYKGTGFRK